VWASSTGHGQDGRSCWGKGDTSTTLPRPGGVVGSRLRPTWEGRRCRSAARLRRSRSAEGLPTAPGGRRRSDPPPRAPSGRAPARPPDRTSRDGPRGARISSGGTSQVSNPADSAASPLPVAGNSWTFAASSSRNADDSGLVLDIVVSWGVSTAGSGRAHSHLGVRASSAGLRRERDRTSTADRGAR
jgi:hypothetical protein